MNTLQKTTPRLMALLGVAALGLAFAIPAHAAPGYPEGAFIVAKREARDEARQNPRDTRGDARRDRRGEAGSEESRGYGYGYERRQQKDRDDDERRRDRR
ncbi:MAG TPA: hypothetical protein PKC12_03595 [Thiobacillaceae bacterium]|nr:hypothetical protein [Thiobacillaceae bacterium]